MSGVDLAPGSATWLRTMTASKIAALLGLSPKWDTPASLWLTMRGDIPYDNSPSPVQKRGQFMEPYALDHFWAERHPDWAMEAGETTWRRDDLPWAAANTDSHGRTADGELVIVEAKSVGGFADIDKWGRPGTDEVPYGYWVQVQWQLHMTHGFGGACITRAYIERVGPCLDDHYEYVVDYDPAAATRIEGAAAAFLLSLDNPDACPPADGHEVTERAFAKRNPEIDRGDEWEVAPELALAYLAAHEAHEAAKSELSLQKAEMLRVAGKAQYLMCAGLKVARRQLTRGTPSLRHAGVALDTLRERIHNGDKVNGAATPQAA